MAKRMFIALDLPPQVAGTLADLDPRLPGLHWFPAPMPHLTLCFLAVVPEENEARLIDGLAGIQVPPFPLELKGLGSFGRRGHPSVIWVGGGDHSREIHRLHRRVLEAVRAAGLKADARPFHPHVTLGRCKDLSPGALKDWLKSHRNSSFGVFDVTGFTLYASELAPEGAKHERVFRRDFETE